MIGKLREYRRLGMGFILVFLGIGAIVIFVASVFLRPDLRCKRDSYSVFKDHAVTSCVVKNHGRRSVEKALMSVKFLSKILDTEISPESAGEVVSVARDQLKAVIELKNIDPGAELVVSFSVEKPQDKPFEVHFLNLIHERPVRERVVP